jgi:hypothetical protein
MVPYHGAGPADSEITHSPQCSKANQFCGTTAGEVSLSSDKGVNPAHECAGLFTDSRWLAQAAPNQV